MIRTLRRKFICVTMAIVTVFLTVILSVIIANTGAQLRSETAEALQRAASEPQGRPGQLRFPCFVIRVTPWGPRIQSSGGFDLSDEEMLSDIVAQAAASEAEIGELPEYSLRFFRKQDPIELTIAFTDISGEEQTMRTLRLSCLAIGAGALLVFWGISVLLARWVVKPVEQAWEEQRQFVADASHELKTPLTVIMTNAELLTTGDGNREQYARSILTMSQQMRSLVEGLLELARVDNGAVRSAFEEVDLSALTEEELLPFEPVYFERGMTLVSEIEPGIHISGSPRHLRQVLGILLDNAMNHAPAGSTVTLRLTAQGGSAQLSVENPGGPLSREDCQNIFRRFYRLDKARSGGGYGLGLPIARGIVTDHGGKIWAESRDGTVIFRVQLPKKRTE